MTKGIKFHHEFSAANLSGKPQTGDIMITHGSGQQFIMHLHGIMAVKASMLNEGGYVREMTVLTTQTDVTCVYRIETDRVVLMKYEGYDNHWEAGYDEFVRTGGWPGNMNPHPEPTVTSVYRVMF